METIFALATVPGKSGVAVIRVSGPEAYKSCDLFGFDVPEARIATLRKLRHAEMGVIDEALVLVFEEGASFTGEPVVEFQVHGSVAIVRSVLLALAELEGFREAEAGEFTRRALVNGRLDLTQVEALADLIEAETEAQRQQAVEGFSGHLRDQAEAWRKRLVRALALLEATIDFADEDVPVDVTPDVMEALDEVERALERECQGYKAAERIRSGFEVAIVGRPNVGKSTLLNALAGREAAITSEVAGTTRDVIEVRMDIGGLAVTLLDTAGLRDTEDEVEKIGVARAKTRAEEADLKIVLHDGDVFPDVSVGPEDIILRSKADLYDGEEGISGKSGKGIPELISRLESVLKGKVGRAGFVSRDRQLKEVSEALRHLAIAKEFLGSGEDKYDFASEEIRQAVVNLELLVGRIDVEHVLDEIFSSFCIGK